MFKHLSIIAFFAMSLGLGLGSTPAQAQGFDALEDVAKITLVPGWRTESGTHMAAIKIELAEGWKTYWRSPGDAGIPPQFDWSASQNLQGVKIIWPTPKIFTTSGFRSIGYSGTTLIPIELTPRGAGGAVIKVNAKMVLGVCEEICVPVSVNLRADFLPTGTPDKAIRASLTHRPKSAAKAGVGAVTCTIEPISDGLRLNARINLPRQGKDEIVVIELPDKSIWVSQADTSRKGRTLSASSDLVPPNGAPFLLSRADVRITVLGDGPGVDIRGCKAG